jgi:hypothetical protein
MLSVTKLDFKILDKDYQSRHRHFHGALVLSDHLKILDTDKYNVNIC